MKKILILALAAILLLPVLPSYAADRTEVYVQSYNNIAEPMLVSVKTPSNSFQGATIYVGDSITHTLTASGAGTHTAEIDISSLTKDGEVAVKVVANYGAADGTDTVEKTANVAKMGTTTTNYNFDNLNTQLNLNKGANGYEKVDDSAIRLYWTAADTKSDMRLGRDEKSNGNVNPGGANLVLDFEVLFQNGTSTEKEQPAAYMFITFRQDRQFFQSGYPYNSTTDKLVSEGDRSSLFESTGKISGSNANYYTNVWYKCRYVFDSVTKQNDKLVGGLKLYIAENTGNGYGDFKLHKMIDYFTIKNLQGFRFEPRAAAADASITIKNIQLSRQEPLKTWYVNSAAAQSDKISVKFTEDMGDIAAGDIKLYNGLNKDENGNVLPEEIAVTSVTNKASGEYEIVPAKTLLYGKTYEIRIENGFKSAGGAIGFLEPATDADGDGYWCLTKVTAPKYSLNVASAVQSGNSVNVTFNNTDVTGKFATVCWYDANGNMVDCAAAQVTTSSHSFTRTTGDTAASFKVFVCGVDSDSESSHFGADTVYEIYN